MQHKFKEQSGSEMPTLGEVLAFGNKMREEAKLAERSLHAKPPVVYEQKHVREVGLLHPWFLKRACSFLDSTLALELLRFE